MIKRVYDLIVCVIGFVCRILCGFSTMYQCQNDAVVVLGAVIVTRSPKDAQNSHIPSFDVVMPFLFLLKCKMCLYVECVCSLHLNINRCENVSC